MVNLKESQDKAIRISFRLDQTKKSRIQKKSFMQLYRHKLYLAMVIDQTKTYSIKFNVTKAMKKQEMKITKTTKHFL